MKALRTLIAVPALIAGIICATARPEITWRETFHNFGAFNEDAGTARTTFRYVNTGDEPLIVIGARTTCGCTLADYSRSPLAPGDSAAITVEYDPAGRPGRFEKGIIVDTNTEPRRTRLTIKGTVVGGEATVRAQYPVGHGPLALRNATALVGDVVKGHMKTIFINAYNRSNDTISPQIGPLPPYIHVSLEPASIPPGEQASFIVYFRSDKCDVWGLTETPVAITPAPGADPFELPVVASVVEDFSALTDRQREKAPVIDFSPRRIEIPELPPPGTPAEASLRSTNRGRSPLEIRRIYSPDPGIHAATPRKTTVKPGKHIDVAITVDTGRLPGENLNARITVISNDPTNPVENIRLTGEPAPVSPNKQ